MKVTVENDKLVRYVMAGMLALSFVVMLFM
jgi:hypothetical protein